MNEKIKWYEKKPNHTSTMRIITMITTITGSIAVLAGVVAMFLSIPEAVLMAGTGAGMTGLGEVAKVWQSKGEK